MPSPITYRRGSIGSNPFFLERSYPRKTNKISDFLAVILRRRHHRVGLTRRRESLGIKIVGPGLIPDGLSKPSASSLSLPCRPMTRPGVWGLVFSRSIFESANSPSGGCASDCKSSPFKCWRCCWRDRGEVVTRDELRNRLWPNTIVEFDHGLNKAISKIREVLGDSVESPRFVETVARRGYRFLAGVAVIDSPDRQREPTPSAPTTANDTAPVDRTDAGAPSKQALRPYIWSLVFGLALVLTASLFWVLYSKNESFPKIRSLAVLPMENLSGDASQDHFADGMTDQLIANLGQISALRVISRTSVMTYKGVRKPLAQIAGELNVDAVVEGSALRSGDQVRITAQLIQVP